MIASWNPFEQNVKKISNEQKDFENNKDTKIKIPRDDSLDNSFSATISRGSSFGKGKNAEASMVTFVENIGPGMTQTSGSSNADDNQATTFGFSKAFFNPNRRQSAN